MKGNPTAVAPGQLNRIVWNTIQDDTDLVSDFVSDCVNVAYERIVERERVAAGGKPMKVTIVNVGSALVPRRAHTVPPAMSANQVAAAQSKGRDKFTKAVAAIEAMRFANGKGILDQTVAEVQQLCGFGTGILRALPRNAAPTDILRKYLTIEQVTKLRTFNV